MFINHEARQATATTHGFFHAAQRTEKERERGVMRAGTRPPDGDETLAGNTRAICDERLATFEYT